MRHKFDLMPQIPTIASAEIRRAPLRDDVSAFIANGGEIQVVKPFLSVEKFPKTAEEHKEKTRSRSFALAEDMKAAKAIEKPKKRLTKSGLPSKGVMSEQERKAKRKADALLRVSLPCPKPDGNGGVCGSLKYNKKGNCARCKYRRERLRKKSDSRGV